MALNMLNVSVINNNIKRYKAEDLTYGRIVCGIAKIFTSSEVLEYFLNQYYVKMNNSVKSNDNILIKYAASILAILMRIYNGKEKANVEVLNRVNDLTDAYEKYIEKFKLDKNEELCNYLDKISKFYLSRFAFNLERHQNQEDNTNDNLSDTSLNSIEEENAYEKVKLISESIKENVNKIKELESEITKLRKVIDKKQKLLEKEQTEVIRLRELNKNKDEEVKDLHKQLTNREKENKSLNEKVGLLEETIESYVKINKSLEEKIKLFSSKTQVANTINISKEKKVKLEKLQEQVISLIVDKCLTIEEIAVQLEKKNIIINLEEIQQILLLLQEKYRIVFNEKCNTYQVKPVNCMTDLTFEIPFSSSCVQLLLMADEHVDAKEPKTYDNFDAIYDYCLSKDLTTIIHIGDLLNFDKGYNKLSEKLERYKKDMEVILKKYPKDLNIKNYYLGGNHEKRIHICGLDPVEYIAKEREDFSSVGYTHAILNVGNDKIALHHPDKRLHTEIKNVVPDYVKDYQERININPEDIYLNIFGHYHRCYLNQEYNYFLAPSYNFTSKSLNAACHLKIYLDSSGKIESISIILLPLVGISRKLMSAGEMEYKKTLQK